VFIKRDFLKIEEEATEDESTRAKTVFFELCRVLLGILKNGESSNLKVKKIAFYRLFPKLVNLSLPFVRAEHSQLYLRLLVRGCQIEWGTEATKMKHFRQYLELATSLVESRGLVLATDGSGILGIQNLKRVLLSFKRCYLDDREPMKRQILSVMLLYLRQLNDQVISKVENGRELFDGTDLLHSVTEDLIRMLKDYFDSVRDQACQLLEFMMTHFLRTSPVMAGERHDLLQILRTSSSMGFSETMHGPTRDAAELEASFIEYMLPDAQEFLRLMITAMMDEPSTRESIVRIILKMHTQLPFLLINDYRISCANNSLQRQEVLKGILNRANTAR